MDNQQITLRTYDDFAEEYDRETPNTVEGEFKDLLDEFLSMLKQDAIILEIGTGAGRDAAYIESRGYKIIRTDASQGTIDLLGKKGIKALRYNPILEEFKGDYDAILAGAVLLHFTPEQLGKALQHLVARLPDGGIFYFWVKSGEGEEYSDHKVGGARYFRYWNDKDLSEIFAKHRMKIKKFQRLADGKWIHALAEKVSK